MLPPVRSTKLCFFAPSRHRGDPPHHQQPPRPRSWRGAHFLGGGSGSWLGCPPQKPSGDGGVTPQAAGVPGWGGGGRNGLLQEMPFACGSA